MLKNTLGGFFLMGVLASTCFAEGREIAITIDDLPFVGANNKNASSIKRSNGRIHSIIKTLVDHKIPAIGFIIGGSIAKEQLPLLEQFRAEGFLLGNHTYSHKSLNSTSAENYIEDVDKADKKLTPFMTTPKYFRYPYLAEGKGDKKQQVYSYLAEHQYTIAPVTIDSKDYKFNAQLLAIHWQQRGQNLKQIKARYLAYIWDQTLKAEARSQKNSGKAGKQILLVHANLLNSHFLGDVIDMYQNNGYKFISLADALAPAPETKLIEASNDPREACLGTFHAKISSIQNYLIKAFG